MIGSQPPRPAADVPGRGLRWCPRSSLFGYYQFRSAVATSDSWEQHDGVEILFMRSGEACWELGDDDQFIVVTGGQAVLFPPAPGIGSPTACTRPCRLLWMVFDGKDVAAANARLFPKREIDALFDIATCQNGSPIDLPDACMPQPRRPVLAAHGRATC